MGNPETGSVATPSQEELWRVDLGIRPRLEQLRIRRTTAGRRFTTHKAALYLVMDPARGMRSE